MMRKISIFAVALLAQAGAAATVAASSPPQGQPYAGQEQRAVTSLSETDVAALLDGQGWGLAKPAELNGYPGPAHVLELADQLELSGEQRSAVQAAFEDMRSKARATGARYVAAEKAIDAAFREGLAADALRDRLAEAERLRAELRLIHLSTHLQVTPLLTGHQKHLYNQLRGYGGGKPHDGHQHNMKHGH